jgi:hypothetical protein
MIIATSEAQPKLTLETVSQKWREKLAKFFLANRESLNKVLQGKDWRPNADDPNKPEITIYKAQGNELPFLERLVAMAGGVQLIGISVKGEEEDGSQGYDLFCALENKKGGKLSVDIIHGSLPQGNLLETTGGMSVNIAKGIIPAEADKMFTSWFSSSPAPAANSGTG